jgi:hypothetical protein
MSRFHLSLLACLLAACASAAPASAPIQPPPAQPAAAAPLPLRFLEGNWESQDPANRWRMTSAWNPAGGRFEGTLTQNGDLSASVGFTVGELVWTATPAADGTVREGQKFRWSSAQHEWREGAVDVAQSTPERLVTSFSVFVRQP